MAPMNETSRNIRLSKASLTAAEYSAISRPFDRVFLGMGAEVKGFEEELAAYLGRPVACVVNGTAALHLALQACGLKAGDEVLVPSLTYVACFQTIAATGATPIACDVREETCTLDVADAERRITSRTRAIMPVHYAGAVGDLEGVYALARRHNLRVIEDAAHAFGSIFRGRPIGGSGDIACFSFDGIKNITAGEGGCVVTDDADVLARVRDARLLGVESDTKARFSGTRSWEFDVRAQGWRYHMSDIMAAIGRTQLGRRQELADRRQYLAQLYLEALRSNGRVVPVLKHIDGIVPHIFPVRIAGLGDRDALRRALREKGIETGVHYRPNHTLTYFAQAAAAPLPVTDRIYPELLTLPLHPDLAEDDISYVCQRLRATLC
jgi:dTDP-4-amino-4,6-dideoxygalactose transaminase